MVRRQKSCAWYLNTVIKSNFPQWAEEFQRWLVPFETMSTTNIVCYERHSIHGENSSFVYDRAAYGFPPRKRHCVYEQAGDTMNAAAMGITLMWWHAVIGIQHAASVSMPQPSSICCRPSGSSASASSSLSFIAALGRTLHRHHSENSDVSAEGESNHARSRGRLRSSRR